MQYRVEGTAAYVPARVATGRTRVKRKKAAKTIDRNRAKALSMSRSYVVFLAIISAATVIMCVRYLKLKETITAQNHVVEQLESQLVTLRSENDALLENVNNSVDLNYIKDVAIHELGMKYATEEQIVWYNTDDSYYMKQYRDGGKG